MSPFLSPFLASETRKFSKTQLNRSLTIFPVKNLSVEVYLNSLFLPIDVNPPISWRFTFHHHHHQPQWIQWPLMESATDRGDSTAVAALNHSDRTKGSRHSSAAPEVNLLRPAEDRRSERWDDWWPRRCL